MTTWLDMYVEEHTGCIMDHSLNTCCFPARNSGNVFSRGHWLNVSLGANPGHLIPPLTFNQYPGLLVTGLLGENPITYKLSSLGKLKPP